MVYYENHNGEEIKFQSKDWAETEDEEFKDYCYAVDM